MYLARNRRAGRTTYALRESVPSGNGFATRELLILGDDPSACLVYPGGNAFYVREDVEAALRDAGKNPTDREMEELFWPFLRPDIRRALEPFACRGRSRRGPCRLTRAEEDAIRDRVHLIDKRRLNYIRFQQLDQTRIGRVPDGFYRPLLGKSRDELEQYFIRAESCLKAHELRTYVFSFFNLRRFFDQVFAGEMPEALDQEQLDELFQEELCRLNVDAQFWGPEPMPVSLHEYLVRYLVMYFDHPFARSRFYENILNDFINRNRFHRFPPGQTRVTIEMSSRIFGVTGDSLRSMSKRDLVRLYRKLALKHHPDQGGDSRAFIELTEAFKSLVRSKRGE